MSEGIVITVSREAYCGGEELAKMICEKAGLKLYDREIISLASQKSGIHEEHFESVEKKAPNSLLYSVVMGMYSSQGPYVKLDDVLTDDKIYKVQTDIIKDAAYDGNCLVVGRCSDYVLREFDNVVNIFFHADMEDRIKIVMSEQSCDENEAKKVINRADKKRKSYYNYYTNREWGNYHNYDLALNLSKLTKEEALDLVLKFISK